MNQQNLVKATNVIGLKVLAKSTGKEIAKVYDVIYSPSLQQVTALVVDEGGWFSSAKIIPMNNVDFVGVDNVVVDSEDVIVKEGETYTDIAGIINKSDHIRDTNMVTDKGKRLGNVTDILFNPRTGEVKEFEVSEGLLKNIIEGKKTVEVDHVVSIGPDATVVSTSVEEEIQKQSKEQGLTGAVATAQENIAKASDTIQSAGQTAAMKANLAMKSAGDKAKDLKDQTQQSFQNIQNSSTTHSVKNKISDSFKQAKEYIQSGQMKSDLTEKAQNLARQTNNFIESSSQNVQQASQTVTEKAENLKDSIEHKIEKDIKGEIMGQYFLNQTIMSEDGILVGNKDQMVDKEMVEKAKAKQLLGKLMQSVRKQRQIAAQ